MFALGSLVGSSEALMTFEPEGIGAVRDVEFDARGKMLAVVGEGSSSVYVVDVEGGTKSALSAHSDYAYSISWGGTMLASCSNDGCIGLWDPMGPNGGAEPKEMLTVGTPTTSVAMRSDAGLVSVGCLDGTVKVYDVESGSKWHDAGAHKGVVTDMVWSPSGQVAMTSSYDTSIAMWDLRVSPAYSRVAVFDAHSDAVMCLDWSGTSALFSGSIDSAALAWDLRIPSRPLAILRQSSSVFSIASSSSFPTPSASASPISSSVALFTGTSDCNVHTWTFDSKVSSFLPSL